MCSVLLCSSVRNITHPRYEKMSMRFAGEFFFHEGYFFLSQNSQILQNFSTNVSNPQNASGIQNSQNVIAKGGCNVL